MTLTCYKLFHVNHLHCHLFDFIFFLSQLNEKIQEQEYENMTTIVELEKQLSAKDREIVDVKVYIHFTFQAVMANYFRKIQRNHYICCRKYPTWILRPALFIET